MAFTDQQTRLLKAKLDAQHVKTRKADGATLHYIEGWHAIAEANRSLRLRRLGPQNAIHSRSRNQAWHRSR
jgi:hypothetical protein